MSKAESEQFCSDSLQEVVHTRENERSGRDAIVLSQDLPCSSLSKPPGSHLILWRFRQFGTNYPTAFGSNPCLASLAARPCRPEISSKFCSARPHFVRRAWKAPLQKSLSISRKTTGFSCGPVSAGN